MKRLNNRTVPDLHTHILPDIDDGSRTVEASLELLSAEAEQGVTDIAFTPHFYIEDIDIKSFCDRRDEAFSLLMKAVENDPVLSGLRFYKGAEVAYSPNLIYEDLTPLCYEGTRYLLLELSYGFPFNLENTLFSLINNGYRPILAHTERYPYLVNDKKLLSSIKEMGVVLQSNAGAVLGGSYKKEVKKLLKFGFVDILSSDTHNLTRRPPRLAEALLKLKDKGGAMISNAVKVITDTEVL